MKRLTTILLLLLPIFTSAQTTRNGRFEPGPLSVRPACVSNIGDVYTTTDNNGVYYCGGTGWTPIGSGSGTPPGGTNGQFQYNNSGSFGGVAPLIFDGSHTLTLSSTGIIVIATGGTLTGITNAMLPGSGGTSINGQNCFLGLACTIPIFPTLPTSPNGVAQSLCSTPSGGVGGTPVWCVGGAVSRAIGSTTSDTVLSTDNKNYIVHTKTSTNKVAESLPTPTSLGLTNPQFTFCNPALPSAGAFDVIVPATFTINGFTNWTVPQNKCEYIYLDPANLTTNWLAVPLGSGILPEYNVSDSPGSAGHMDPQGCNTLAVSAKGICNMEAAGNTATSFGSTLNLGDPAGGLGASTGIRLPASGSFTSSITSGTGCGVELWNGVNLMGSGGNQTFVFGPTNAFTSSQYGLCTDGSGNYIQADNFSHVNKVATYTGGYAVHVNKISDAAFLNNFLNYEYINKGMLVESACCSAHMDNYTGYMNNTGLDGVTFTYTGTGVSNHSFAGHNWSVGHNAAGSHAIVYNDFTTAHNVIYFDGAMYHEVNPAATASCEQINRVAMLHLPFVDGCGSTVQVPVVEFTATSGQPMVVVEGISIGSNGSQIVIKNSNTTLCRTTPCNTFTDSLGHMSRWSSMVTCTSLGGTCGDSERGAVTIAVGSTSVTVATTRAPADASDITINQVTDATIQTALGITCNATPTPWFISNTTAGTGFTVNVASVATNKLCLTFEIANH